MIVPLIGARRRTQLAESLGALQVELSREDMTRIEEAIPASAVAGTRYDAQQMRVLDSERQGSQAVLEPLSRDGRLDHAGLSGETLATKHRNQ